MKVSILSNAYSCLNPKIKGKAWRSLTDAELLALKNEKQVISNCYDVAVRYALLAIEKGKEIFRNVIKISKNPGKSRTCKITFNINGKKKSYRYGRAGISPDSRLRRKYEKNTDIYTSYTAYAYSRIVRWK